MRSSEFWQSMDHAFGPAYAKSLASDLVVGALGSRTAAEALEAGTEPQAVWQALCDALDLDDATRWHYRAEPKKRRR